MPFDMFTASRVEVAGGAVTGIEASGKYRVVPVEPTEEMVRAGYDALVADWPKDWGKDGCTPEKYQAMLAYPAMLSAAPKVTA